MASRKAYLEFILEQLSGLDGVRYQPMMGEYLLYYRGKLFGEIYDDRLLVKPVKAAMTECRTRRASCRIQAQSRCCSSRRSTGRNF